MPYPQTTSTENFLRDIDEVLVQYTSLLCSKGYSNTRVLAHLTLPDISELPIGHRRLLINEVNKIWSPHSKALLTAIDSQELQTAGTESLRPKELFPRDHSDSSGTLDTVDWEKIDPRIEEYQYSSPMDKHLNSILNDIEMKDNEITKLRSELQSMSSCLDDEDAIDSRPCCSQCHEQGHKKNKCSSAKCLLPFRVAA